MNKYHYWWHDGKEGYVLADELKLENSETTGLDNTKYPVQSWIFYRGGIKYGEMPAYMVENIELVKEKKEKAE